MRTLVIASAGAALLAIGTVAVAQNPDLGPSFDCEKAKAPLAQIICGSPELSALDIRFSQAYWALLQQVGTTGSKALKAEDVAFINHVQNQCGIPATGPVRDPERAGFCVLDLYEKQRQLWLARLTGAAREEATRPATAHLALQEHLQQLGYLPSASRIDGVYGSAVRQAIEAWQTAAGRPTTGFLGDADAAVLTQQALSKPAPAPPLVTSTGSPTETVPSGCEAETVTVLIDNESTAVTEIACPNPDRNWYYTPAKLPSRRTCADLKITVPINGKPTDAYGTACTDKDGQWRVIEPVSVPPNIIPASGPCETIADDNHKLLICKSGDRTQLINHYMVAPVSARR